MGDNFILSNENHVNNVVSDEKSAFRKTKSSMNIIKVALYMLTKNKTKSKKSKSVTDLPNATNATISRLVGLVRPLHLQDGIVGGQSPLPALLPPHSPRHPLSADQSSTEWGEAVSGMLPHIHTPSPLRSCSSSSSISQASSSSPSTEGLSHYTSAQSLYDLDDNGDGEVSCDTPRSGAYYDGIEGDEMIDLKAETFIAKMYQQMRLQDIE